MSPPDKTSAAPAAAPVDAPAAAPAAPAVAPAVEAGAATTTPAPSPAEDAAATEAVKAAAEKQAAVDAAEAAKTDAEKQLKKSAGDQLAALAAEIKRPTLETKDNKETLLSKAKEKVGKYETSFTKKSGKAFFDGILEKAKADLAAEKDGEKKAALYAYDVSDKFCTQFMEKYYFLFVDGVSDDVELKVVIEKGVVDIKEVDPAKIQVARDAAKSKIEAAAATANVPQEIKRFEKEHPEAFLFLKQVVFKNDAEMNEAFKGGGLIGFFLGVLGYGGGKTIYGSIMKMDWFSKYHDSVLDSLAKLHPSLDFRDPIELEKNEDLSEYYNNLPKEELRFVGKKFVARNAITLPVMTTFRYIVFPKGADKVTFPGGMLKKGVKVSSLTRDERHENITVPAGTILEAGTVFSDIEIGDKAKIEAAKNGEAAPAAAAAPAVAPTTTPASGPAPAASPAPVPAVAPSPAPSAPAPAAPVPKGR